MAGFVDIKFEYFFDKIPLESAADKAEKKNLSKFGAFVRQTARNSIRKSKKISKPGNPPRSHEGSLKRLIYFAYSFTDASVVIGPLLFSTGVAEVLEYGGTLNGKYYKARPFMQPAFEKESSKIDKIFLNSIK